MNHLDRLESQSIYILREAFNKIERLGLLWSMGKDSTVMLWLARKAFFGHMPFPLLHIDSGDEFAEIEAFGRRLTDDWGLDLVRGDCPPLDDIDNTLPPAARAAARRTAGLKALIDAQGFTGVAVGIRRDEEGSRAKERVFSTRGEDGEWKFRDQPREFWDQFNTDFPPGAHVRIHQLLAWTEIDIWRYIAREAIPVVDLYFTKDGKRYRSLGEPEHSEPMASSAATVTDIIAELETTTIAERAGRAADHEGEGVFERLRVEGHS
jgi:sulfate adenylyltransferase subunit 2